MSNNFFYEEEDLVNYPAKEVVARACFIYYKYEVGAILKCDDKVSAEKIVEVLNSVDARLPY